jgi:hypothetical protein
MTELELRKQIISQARKWLGSKEADGTHKPIIDIYNKHKPLARGYKVKYTDSWCATFVSVISIQLDLTDIIPTECGCEKQIELFKKIGRWEEDGRIVPAVGDIIYYNWDDATQSNDGHADHVGYVADISGNTLTIIEGNYQNSVKERKIKVGSGNIRGYGKPNYEIKTNSVASTSMKAASKEKNPYKEPSTNLRYIKSNVGKVSDNVKWLQWELNEAGNTLVIDGKFGDKTRLALLYYQKSSNLVVDGICGTKTRESLKKTNR